MGRICPEFKYLPVISRPEEEPIRWNGPVGYIQDLWGRESFFDEAGFKPDPEDTHIFLCGNPTMIEMMLTLLENIGFNEHTKNLPGTVHLERYW
jgi:ferredoxin--NADP+ reductase